MDKIEDDYNQREVNYKFYLPDNRGELSVFQKTYDFFGALDDIYERCRYVWKYKEDATVDEVELAERIGEIVMESGIFECE